MAGKNNYKKAKKAPVKKLPDFFGKPIEYQMSPLCAKNLLATRSAEEQKLHPTQFLAKVVNEQYGLLGHCVNVIIA